MKSYEYFPLFLDLMISLKWGIFFLIYALLGKAHTLQYEKYFYQWKNIIVLKKK